MHRQAAPALHCYHLAHGLLDHAEHLPPHRRRQAAAAATGEAHGIAQRLGCQRLLDRASARLSSAKTLAPPSWPMPGGGRRCSQQADIGYTLTFEPTAAGTRMRWSGQVRPRGAYRLLGPVIIWMGRTRSSGYGRA